MYLAGDFFFLYRLRLQLHAEPETRVEIRLKRGNILEHFIGHRNPCRDLSHGIRDGIEDQRRFRLQRPFRDGRGRVSLRPSRSGRSAT